ncbi:MAG: indolepyruvate oxidoreductase subunit beta [Candidatus Aenigmatarchaeota archaeon]|nr:indolepyruvate oxidoreductase subunit beta [Nanoarchaeota archaeon]
MTTNILLTGVGGEGVLVTSVIIARAADIEGYEVRGTQLHGLAQRGGSIPTHVRFGRDVHSPLIPRGQADLILGLEPLEAARDCYFASKNRTGFVIDTYHIKTVYANLLGEKYPDDQKIAKIIEPFSKKTILTDASNICREKIGDPIFGNVMAIGVALGAGLLPLKKESIIEAMKRTVPRGIDKNTTALNLGLEFKG